MRGSPLRKSSLSPGIAGVTWRTARVFHFKRRKVLRVDVCGYLRFNDPFPIMHCITLRDCTALITETKISAISRKIRRTDAVSAEEYERAITSGYPADRTVASVNESANAPDAVSPTPRPGPRRGHSGRARRGGGNSR